MPTESLFPVVVAVLTSAAGALSGGIVTHLWDKAKYGRLLEHETTKHARLLEHERKKLADFQASCTYWSEADYSVLVDGPQSAGKSALVAKWADPTVDITKLSKTAGLATLALFLCSQNYERDGQKRETRHRLKFYDVPGEGEDILLSVIFKKEPKFILLVVDPEQEEVSFQRLNTGHIKTLYANPDVADKAAGLLVYVSKEDKVSADTMKRVKERVDAQIIAPLKHRYHNATIFSGSALDGKGLHAGLAYMIKNLGLDRYYVKHQSVGT